MINTRQRREPPVPERFQFRIRDLLLVMILAGLLATAIARDNIILLYVFGLVFGLFLRFFWKRPTLAKVLVVFGCILLFFVFHWAGEIKARGAAHRPPAQTQDPMNSVEESAAENARRMTGAEPSAKPECDP